jgi:hypothetical protein
MHPPDVGLIAANLQDTLQQLAIAGDLSGEGRAALIDRARDLADDLTDAVDTLPQSEDWAFARVAAEQLVSRITMLERALSARVQH